jgi:hypothetical protein
MTTSHPGAPTKPLVVGAPLDPDRTGRDVPAVDASDVLDELHRAEYELLYALARHRKAWSAMRAYAREQELRQANRGQPQAFLDSDPIWKVKTGDVSWWRGEVAAQAAAVTALKSMLPQPVQPQPEPLDGWAEVTGFEDIAAGRRTFLPHGGKGPTVRQLVLSWEPGTAVSNEQVAAAKTWLRATGATIAGPGHNRMAHSDWVACVRLLNAANSS